MVQVPAHDPSPVESLRDFKRMSEDMTADSRLGSPQPLTPAAYIQHITVMFADFKNIMQDHDISFAKDDPAILPNYAQSTSSYELEIFGVSAMRQITQYSANLIQTLVMLDNPTWDFNDNRRDALTNQDSPSAMSEEMILNGIRDNLFYTNQALSVYQDKMAEQPQNADQADALAKLNQFNEYFLELTQQFCNDNQLDILTPSHQKQQSQKGPLFTMSLN